MTLRGLAVSPALRWVALGDCTFLMDIGRGTYFGLDPQRSEIWTALAAQDFKLCGLTGEEALLEEAMAKGWLVPDPPQAVPPPGPRSAGRATAVLALACLIRASLMLRLMGFGRTYAHTSRLHAALPTHEAASDVVVQAMAAFTRAEHVWMARLGRDCLPRSLALFAFLRRAGIPATHRIGIRRYPFAAHAWVECGGALLHGAGGTLQAFTPIATIGR